MKLNPVVMEEREKKKWCIKRRGIRTEKREAISPEMHSIAIS